MCIGGGGVDKGFGGDAVVCGSGGVGVADGGDGCVGDGCPGCSVRNLRRSEEAVDGDCELSDEGDRGG